MNKPQFLCITKEVEENINYILVNVNEIVKIEQGVRTNIYTIYMKDYKPIQISPDESGILMHLIARDLEPYHAVVEPQIEKEGE